MDQAFLDNEFLGVTVMVWGQLALLWIAFSVALLLVRRVFFDRFSALAERTRNQVDDVVAAVLQGTRRWFLILFSLYMAVNIILDDTPAVAILLRIVFLGAFVQFGLWGNGLIKMFATLYAASKGEEAEGKVTAIRALSMVGRLIIWSILFLLVLDNFGINVTALAATLGIGSLAIAFAVQNVLQDLLAYVSIVFDQPFVYGDYLVLGEYSGTVEHVGIKSTRIRSLSGEQLVIGNNDLLSSRIRNYKRMFERRAVFSVGVTYDTPHDKLQAISGWLEGIIGEMDDIRFDRAHLKSFDDFAITFEIVYYALLPEYGFYMDAQQAMNLAIHRKFGDEGVEFAFPTQTIHVESMPSQTTQG